MASGAFDKDFGYLMPFLEKVAAAANSLADPASREELTRLMAGEKQRWSRIRELLGGDQNSPSSSTQTAATAQAANSDVAPPQAASNEARPAPAFTVGSLRPQS
ncbi:MAG TPA: hypothetical protein VFQ92_01615 [Blastocatellia bacterium]|nr:hypothetical protein [Blastocatellia bacterium]